jgi:hypothetical protein
LETTSFSRQVWKGLAMEDRELAQDDRDYEQQLVHELEEGEMKIASVLNYYKMAQHLESVNQALRTIISELSEDVSGILQKEIPIR